MENILEVNNLNKNYKDFSLKNVSFQLEKGYIMGFIGPNGAGKTSVIKLIMNLIKKESGSIKIFGMDNMKYEKDVKEKIGFVYDETYCYEDLKLIDMKNILARFYKNWDDKAFNKYMLDFNLPKNKKIKELSKGMKIKYSLAIALSHNAEFIIMDEPTSGLDPVFRRELLDILRSVIQDENKSIFFSTHITTDLEEVADYITFINNGSIFFSDTKDNILDKYKVVKGNKSLIDNDTKKAFIGIKQNAFGFEGLTDNAEKVKEIFGKEVLIERASLEDIMVYTVVGYKDV